MSRNSRHLWTTAVRRSPRGRADALHAVVAGAGGEGVVVNLVAGDGGGQVVEVADHIGGPKCVGSSASRRLEAWSVTLRVMNVMRRS